MSRKTIALNAMWRIRFTILSSYSSYQHVNAWWKTWLAAAELSNKLRKHDDALGETAMENISLCPVRARRDGDFFLVQLKFVQSVVQQVDNNPSSTW